MKQLRNALKIAIAKQNVNSSLVKRGIGDGLLEYRDQIPTDRDWETYRLQFVAWTADMRRAIRMQDEDILADICREQPKPPKTTTGVVRTKKITARSLINKKKRRTYRRERLKYKSVDQNPIITEREKRR